MRRVPGVLSIFFICAPPFRQPHPHFIADSVHCSRMVPRMGVEANYFRGGGTRGLGALAVFREYMLRALEISTGSTLVIL